MSYRYSAIYKGFPCYTAESPQILSQLLQRHQLSIPTDISLFSTWILQTHHGVVQSSLCCMNIPFMFIVTDYIFSYATGLFPDVDVDPFYDTEDFCNNAQYAPWYCTPPPFADDTLQTSPTSDIQSPCPSPKATDVIDHDADDGYFEAATCTPLTQIFAGIYLPFTISVSCIQTGQTIH